MTLKAIIFDMDDTLIDWGLEELDWFDYDRVHLRGVYDYVNATLEQPLVDYDGFVELHQALTVDTWLAAGKSLEAPHLGRVVMTTLAQLGVPTDRLDMDACLRAYDWDGVPGVLPFQEVSDVLVHLGARGLHLGIITNAYQPMWMRDHELATLGLPPELFSCRVSSADVGYLKPHPAVFEQVMGALDITADQAVFIGDSLSADIVGAQGVGMKAVWRVRADESPEEAGAIVPDAVVSTLWELPPLLDEWYPGWHNGA